MSPPQAPAGGGPHQHLAARKVSGSTRGLGAGQDNHAFTGDTQEYDLGKNICL